MATSFAFLDKPAKGLTTAAQGPQPKPQTSARGFLDLSNPWAVPGVTAGAPARPSASSGTTAKTPAKTTTKPKADIPTRGYNYTESSTASGQPAAVRQREVDQATMSGQAAGQRRAAAKAQPEPEPVRPVASAAPTANGLPLGLIVPPTSYMIPAVTSMAQRALNRWVSAMGGQPVFDEPTSAPTPATKTAPTATAGRPEARALQLASNWWQDATTVQPQAQTSPLATPAAPGTAPTATTTATAPATSDTTPAPAAPPAAPPTVDRRAAVQGNLQPGQVEPWVNSRPVYTATGMRALLPENVLAAEDARRQREAAGGWNALMASGQYRPWTTLSTAEKQQRRFAPEQVTAAEMTRLAPVRRQAVTAGMAQRYDQIGWQPSTPAATTASAASTAPAATAAQPLVVTAREIAQRYLTGLDVSEMELQDIVYLLSKTNPPAHMKAFYERDMRWLIEQLPKE